MAPAEDFLELVGVEEALGEVAGDGDLYTAQRMVS
jgi:hypothetical protein